MRLIETSQLESHYEYCIAPVNSSPVGDAIVVSYLSELSKEILTNKKCREYPDIITFGYFCRKSSIHQALAYRKNLTNCFGWGNAIHIAPSNVPVNFAFSFVFGLLSGNSNLVRLPSTEWPQVNILIEIFEKIASLEKYLVLKKRNAFIRTQRNYLKLNEIIATCDVLIVWGGDETVSTFRKLTKKPRCIELYFPNRKSSLLLNAKQVNKLSSEDLLKIAQSFYNDTYIVDNNACSSPRKIFWIGDQVCVDKAKIKFWMSVNKVLIDNNYELNIISKIDKYLDVLSSVCMSKEALPIKKISEDIWINEIHDNIVLGRLGRFSEASFKTFSEALERLEVDEQTLTYYGFKIEDLNEAIYNSKTFVDRVVPLGMALDIGFYWDGVDIIQRLSRKITFV